MIVFFVQGEEGRKGFPGDPGTPGMMVTVLCVSLYVHVYHAS